jgi:flagellar biosynthesis chaperone FliJ
VVIKRARNDLQNAEDDLAMAQQNRDELRQQLSDLSVKT